MKGVDSMMFDALDCERRQPSSDTPRCAVCEEAARPEHGPYCFRHAVMAVSAWRESSPNCHRPLGVVAPGSHGQASLSAP
jgi:hypothetical protein